MASLLRPRDIMHAPALAAHDVVLNGVSCALVRDNAVPFAGGAVAALVGAFQARGTRSVALQLWRAYSPSGPSARAVAGVEAALDEMASAASRGEQPAQWGGLMVYI
jgi:hypothetical protein